jgi:hypothetical protein
MQDVVLAEGRLLRSTVIRSSASKSSPLYALIVLEGRNGRFWNDALKDGNAWRLDRTRGSQVRVPYAPRRPCTLLGAKKSYGL